MAVSLHNLKGEVYRTMPRTKAVESKKVTFYFTMRTWDRLVEFVQAKHGGKLPLSLEVELAVREYLARHRREV